MQLSEPLVLDQSEIERIHAQSLRVLQAAGVRVQDPECRDLLARAGVQVDPDGEKVHLPGRLVEECLALAPSRFRLHRRDGTAVEIGLDTCVFGSLVIDPWIIDYETQEPRRPVLEDVVRHTRLGDALDNVDFLYRMDMPPEDVPGEHAFIRTLEAFAVNTTKPMMAAPASLESLADWLELGEILAGGRPLAERPTLCLCAPVTTPLTFQALNAEIMKAGVRRGLPLCAQTEPIAGTTAPLSFAGGLLMGNCENLFLVVMAQLIKPGAAIAYSVGNALTDLRTGCAIFYPAEKMLWKIASAQMARFYRLPIGGEATGSLVGRNDTQNGIEHALQMLPVVVSGGGMFNGLGSCYNACGMSAEMVVIHSDLARLIGRIRLGVEVSDKMLAADAIIRAGPGGHFLEDPLTLAMLRSGEFFTEGCFDRTGERSTNRFEDSLLARAHRRAEALLAAHTPATPADIAKEVHRWAERKCEASYVDGTRHTGVSV
jgi:trimethylamine---corrinoid protein Co-methyltransferase